jgi:hypothetical protein
LESCCPCFRDLLVLVDGAAADPDRADYGVVCLERHGAGEHHEPSLVAGVDSKQRLARLAQWRQGVRAHVEGSGGESPARGGVDAGQPCSVHAGEGDEVVALVDDGNLRRDTISCACCRAAAVTVCAASNVTRLVVTG